MTVRFLRSRLGRRKAVAALAPDVPLGHVEPDAILFGAVEVGVGGMPTL
jgi:hypothetical protein